MLLSEEGVEQTRRTFHARGLHLLWDAWMDQPRSLMGPPPGDVEVIVYVQVEVGYE